ncbi:MAG: hypothetical protein JW802_04350 [Campylobacterales bacterium]|nr:hypothetical protein [Campylobacterales bacterium]MBN2831885.1 hypothetical protein [Campylobacterales bacterium]
MTLKSLVILFCFALTLFAHESSSFKERRYSYALDKDIFFEGFITFNDASIMIEYVKPESKVLTYFEEKLSIQDDKGFWSVDAQQMPSLSYLFMIIKAVHEQNSLLLERFFDATTQENQTKLLPKEAVAHVLEEVIITYQNKRLHSLHVKMKNKDRIEIEILD